MQRDHTKHLFDFPLSKPAEFAAYIRSEADKYARVIKASGARAD